MFDLRAKMTGAAERSFDDQKPLEGMSSPGGEDIPSSGFWQTNDRSAAPVIFARKTNIRPVYHEQG